MVNMPEILAPAGSKEQLIAAASCGADAVYLGGAVLNARRGADNFDHCEMKQAVEYCHVRGMKVHLALNTVVLPKEEAAARHMLQTACAIGIDAVIINDMGLAAFARKNAPEMPLHASTQMSVHNLSGVRALEELGFSRVVLAREMSRDEIAAITENTTIETEVFIHGALCMCVSGQCYMSSIIGERSGNRGMCAQPCRLPFYVAQKGLCGLSLKDLSLVEKMNDLRELGVSSVKIEGRMKRPEYVAAAVTACRAAREGRLVDTNTLQSVFSRAGFTQGYYNAKRGSEMFGTRGKEDVVAADGVLKGLAQLYLHEMPRVGLSGELTLRSGEAIALKLHDSDGNEAFAAGMLPEIAVNKPTTDEMLRRALEKLGGTPYRIDDVKINCEDGLAVPVSAVNELRRTVLDGITKQRACLKPVTFVPENSGVNAGEEVYSQKLPDTPPLYGRFAKAEQLPDADALAKLDLIVLPVKEAAKVLDWEIIKKLAGELPRIDFENYAGCEEALSQLKQRGIKRIFAGNLGGIWFAKQHGFTPVGDWGLNVTNAAALDAYAELGCEAVTASYELNLNDVKHIRGAVPFGMLGYGYLPLMIMRNCPVKNEKSCMECKGKAKMYDRLGNSFVVGCGGEKKLTEVYNCLPLYLADRLPELRGTGFVTLYFTTEEKAECARVINEYKSGGERENKTRGLYYRSLQ
ncbi:MAG: U32 family peptidase [Hydrogenoanaerobacterium sp.]